MITCKSKLSVFNLLTTCRTQLALLPLVLTGSIISAQVSITTYHSDNRRTGQNLSESYLTLSNVNKSTFGKLFSVPVDGYVYAQPLLVPNVNIPGRGTHNVVYVVTEHDSIFAFDADTNARSNSQPLWHVSFINPSIGTTTVDVSALISTCDDLVPEVGITSTPVIDTGTNTMYVVAKTSENGAIVQRLHALDITTGSEKFGGPVVIGAQVPGNGVGSTLGILKFDPLYEHQRAGLLLQNGLVYIAWGSHCDKGPWHGWIMAYDAGTLNQTGVWVSTPNGGGGGVWQGGDGLAADSDSVYFGTGNGTFTLNIGGRDSGDSIIKLSSPVGGGALSIVDYFTPFNEDLLRLGNTDLGSGGVMLLPDQASGSPHPHLLAAGDKEGTLFLVDRDSMGKYSSATDQNLQTLATITNPIFSTPAWWNNHIYLGTGGGKPLQAFGFDPATSLLTTTPISMSSNILSGLSGTTSISAQGNSNAIVWALNNGGYPNQRATVLYAYDADNLGTLLYSSTQSGARDALGPAVKFAVPSVANGKVYVGTANQVDVLGLFGNVALNAGGGQTAIAGSTLPVALTVMATDAYSGNALAGATLTFTDGGQHGTFTNPTPVTDSSGTASTTYTLPTKAEKVTITISAPEFVTTQTTELSVAGPPASIVIKSGNNQIGPPSTVLPAPFVTRVRDKYGNPVPGITVNFSDNGMGGSFTASQVNTDAQGFAKTLYTTPPSIGTFKVKATVSSLIQKVILTVTVQ